jgi:hypothetical protein
MEIEGNDFIELNSLQSEESFVCIEKSMGNIADPVIEQFKATLQAIQNKIDEGKKEEALDLVNKELKALDEKYIGCYLFPELAEFKSSLFALQNELNN